MSKHNKKMPQLERLHGELKTLASALEELHTSLVDWNKAVATLRQTATRAKKAPSVAWIEPAPELLH